MAIKILSGILVTRDHRDGRVRIDLDTNTVVDGPTQKESADCAD